MNIQLPRLILLALAALSLTFAAWAQSSVEPRFASQAITAYPPYLVGSPAGPMMMLTASRDHTLFSPIYSDYEDVDGDGVVDYTFKPDYRYYGYFSSDKCYAYEAGRFVPKAMAGAVAGKAGAHRCNLGGATGQWAGNYLNWATMTRLDVVRKIFYGGQRQLDTDGDTTLEMAALAHDAHAFVKYYSGADIGDHTPFTDSQLGGAGLTICNRGSSRDGLGQPVMRIAKGNYSMWATTPFSVCNWQEEQPFNFGEKAQAFYKHYGPPGGGSAKAHRTSVPSETENGGSYSGGGPELNVRVQACLSINENDTLKGERCRAYLGADGKVLHKPVGLLQDFGTSASTQQPARADFGLISGSYDDNFLGGRLRKNVGSLNDEVDQRSGRFCHKLTGGVTGTSCPASRSGGIIESFDKIRLYGAGSYESYGTGTEFAFPSEVKNGQHPSWGNPMSEMVTQALAYFAGLPLNSDKSKGTARDVEVGLPTGVQRQDPLNDALIDPVSGLTRRALHGRSICRPMHMLAISSGAVTHDTDDGDEESVYGTAAAFMAKNAPSGGASTVQGATHQVGEWEGVNSSKRSVGSVTAGFGSDCTAKSIGTVVSNGLAQVAGVCPEAPALKGSYLGAGAALVANTRAIRSLSDLTADTGGSIDAKSLPPQALRVRSHAATLSGGVARVEVPIPGKPGKFAYITPESSWDFTGYRTTNGQLMPGAMLTFRAIHSEKDDAKKTASASFVVTWNDTQFGGDYDMDIVGFLRWEMAPSSERPGAYTLTVLTDILNYEAGAMGSHGFSVMGASDSNLPTGFLPDGRYLTHGGQGYRATGSDCAAFTEDSEAFQMRCRYTEGGMAGSGHFAWPTEFGGASVGFWGSSAPKSSTVAKKFLITNGADAVTLRDPLWFIAKYGGFNTGEKDFALSTTAMPDKPTGQPSTNWDSEHNNGQGCAAGVCADGEPDGYFLARRPELLEKRLADLFGRIMQSSNSAPATSTVQLVSGSLKYTAEFFSDGFGGTIKAYPALKDGGFATTSSWDASQKMMAAANRLIITDDGRQGALFEKDALKGDDWLAYRAAMLGGMILSDPPTAEQKAAADVANPRIASLLNYMRGGSDETRRARKDGVMGPIVNATPWLQSKDMAARYTDASFPQGTPSYLAHVNAKAAQPSVLWVGSNDGMLHGINALSGAPLLSYVPSPLVGRLDAALSSANTSAVALVDGSPATADVLVASGSRGFAQVAADAQAWHTYLFGSLGRGGRAVFALDVSKPGDWSDASEAPGAFKWVFSSKDDGDLGYALQDPVRHPGTNQPSQVVRLNSGGFGLLLPNGHGSDNGRAALFILSVNGPSTSGWQASSSLDRGSFRKMVLPALSGQSGQSNGLMGATWVDLDNNGTADVVYATDLLGNLWKFDIRSSDPNLWGSALLSTAATPDAVPLFSSALPITTAPMTYFPTFGGTMVSFGTGRAIDAGDFPNFAATQRFITVWDKGRYPGDQVNPPTGPDANVLPSLTGKRWGKDEQGNAIEVDTFVKRVVRRDASGNVYQVQTNAQGQVQTDAAGQEVPMTNLGSAQRFQPAVHDGWYFDFPGASEMVVNTPIRRLNFMVFTTVRSKSEAEREQACSLGPQGSLYAFNPVSGLPIQGLFSTDSLYMGVNIDDTKVTVASDARGPSYTIGGKTKTVAMGNKRDTDLTSSASNLRIQWREIPGLRTQSTKGKP